MTVHTTARLTINFKQILLSVITLLSPLFFFGQTLTGLWSGVMSNDSTTVRKDQSFEIALTEYKGKVYGYSCSEFIVDDTLFYIVKRVKGTIDGDVCEVTDDEIVAYNFRGKLDKGVKVTSTFRRNNSDSTWYLDGTWKTNVTKKYYAVTGKVGLKEEKDMALSKLFPHLEELNLANDVAFYKERTATQMTVRVAKPETIRSEYSTITPFNTAVVVAPDLDKAEPQLATVSIPKRGEEISKPGNKSIEPASVDIKPAAVNKTVAEQQGIVSIRQQEDVALEKTRTNNIPATSVNVAPVATNKKINEDYGTVAISKQEKIVQSKTETKNIPPSSTNTNTVAVKQNPPATTKPAPVNVTTQNNPVAINKPAPASQPVAKTDPAPNNTTTPKQPVSTTTAEMPVIAKQTLPKKSDEEIERPAAIIEGRKSEFSQIVNFKADSLVLALYDNGEIDGDTVSVFMNGEVLMAKQGLKSSAIKKTIYITPGKEDFTLVLFADNLGKYPPNTGLLVVHDGNDIYNIRFSSDMQKSTGIVFRRKQ